MTALITLNGRKNSIFKGIIAMLIILQLGPMTAFAQQEKDSPETAPAVINDVAPEQQPLKTPADPGIASLIDLLQKKNLISADEAAGLREQVVSNVPGASQDIAALVELLKKKNVISNDEAAGLTQQTAAPGMPEKGVAIVSETNEKEQIAELQESVSHVSQKVAELYAGKAAELAAAAPEWSKRVRFGGDVRLRYENDRYDKNNAVFAQPAAPTQLMNTQINSDRFKYRVRAGVDVDVAKDQSGNTQLQAGIGLATGNTSNPVSTNTIFGDFMNKDNILIDRAYLKLTYKTVGNMPTSYTLLGGRMPNPWFSTELVWDNDINFEGLALNVRQPLTETESMTPFLTIGAFPLQQNDFSQRGKWLLGGQAGIENKNRTGVGYKVAAAYYHFTNITGIANDPLNPGATDWTAPLFQQKGNTLFNISADPTVFKTAYASKFKELNLTGALDIGFWDPYHIVLLGDYVKNLGYNSADVERLAGKADKETTGYQIGLSVDKPSVETYDDWQRNWKAFLYYKYIGSDAVVDAFTDSDFHLGGTNARGWVLGAELGLMKNAWLTARWMTANEISGPKLAIDVLQVDFNVRF